MVCCCHRHCHYSQHAGMFGVTVPLCFQAVLQRPFQPGDGYGKKTAAFPGEALHAGCVGI